MLQNAIVKAPGQLSLSGGAAGGCGRGGCCGGTDCGDLCGNDSRDDCADRAVLYLNIASVGVCVDHDRGGDHVADLLACAQRTHTADALKFGTDLGNVPADQASVWLIDDHGKCADDGISVGVKTHTVFF